jgi:hypothetical protein
MRLGLGTLGNQESSGLAPDTGSEDAIMPGFQVDVPHQLGRQQAIERLKQFADTIVEQYKDQVSKSEGNWVDNVLTFALTTYGFTISGSLTVEDSAVRLEGQLPFAALPFKGKIEQSFAAALQKKLT